MQRWHSQHDTSVMIRRWKEAQKGYWRPHGIGELRKRTLSGHHSHCLLCNGEKYLLKGRRRQERREAVRFELSEMEDVDGSENQDHR